MWHTLKRLALGLVLIVAASALLLVSDLDHRTAGRKRLPRVALFQMTSRPLLDTTILGIRQGLAGRGFEDGRTAEFRTYNANGDLPTANCIAKAIVDEAVDLVATASTPALQVMAAANREGTVRHVFAAVTDPFESGVGLSRINPLAHPRHLVGIGTFQPVEEVFRIAKRLCPDLKTVGEVWCQGETCSRACTVLARKVAADLGIRLIEANVDDSASVLEAARSLVARNVQALWVGGDNVVEMSVSSMVKAAREGHIPVFTNEPFHAQEGALLSLGGDYHEIGRLAGDLAGQLLNGLDPMTVRIENKVPPRLAFNLAALVGLRDRWQIPPDLLARSEIVADGAKKGPSGPGPASSPSPRGSKAAVRLLKKPRMVFFNFVDSGFTTETNTGFVEELSAHGLVGGRDYELKFVSAQGEMGMLQSMIDSVRSDPPDLLLLTSTPTLQAVARRITTLPVVFGAVANPVTAGAGKSNTDHMPNISGIATFADLPAMLPVLKECLPRVRRVGTLFVPSEINSVTYKRDFDRFAAEQGIELKAVPVSTSSEVADAALQLAGSDIDAICQILDNLTDNAFPAIVQAARKQRKPLFCFVSTQVKTGGAAVAVARDFEQTGRDMAEVAIRVLQGESPAGIPFRPVSKTRIVVSPKNASLCGLTIPRSLLERADEVVGQ